MVSSSPDHGLPETAYAVSSRESGAARLGPVDAAGNGERPGESDDDVAEPAMVRQTVGDATWPSGERCTKLREVRVPMPERMEAPLASLGAQPLPRPAVAAFTPFVWVWPSLIGLGLAVADRAGSERRSRCRD